jgi:hypothetical protein
MNSEQIYFTKTFQDVINDTGMAEAIDEYNFQENLKALIDFNPSKPIVFHTRGGKITVDKSVKSGLLRFISEDDSFPSETKISFDKFKETSEHNPKQIALFFAQQNFYELKSDENSVNELEMDDVNTKKEEL